MKYTYLTNICTDTVLIGSDVCIRTKVFIFSGRFSVFDFVSRSPRKAVDPKLS